MSKSIRKHITIEIEFNDYKCIKQVFNKIANEIQLGKRYERQKRDGAIYQYQIDLLTYLDYEERMIDGKWCQVFQSKMNEPKPIKARRK